MSNSHKNSQTPSPSEDTPREYGQVAKSQDTQSDIPLLLTGPPNNDRTPVNHTGSKAVKTSFENLTDRGTVQKVSPPWWPMTSASYKSSLIEPHFWQDDLCAALTRVPRETQRLATPSHLPIYRRHWVE